MRENLWLKFGVIKIVEQVKTSKPLFSTLSPGSGHNGYTKAMEGEEGGGEGEEEEGREGDGGGGGQGRGGEDREEEWDEELDGEAEDGVRMTRTDTLHSTTSSTGTQRRRGQHAKKQVRQHTKTQGDVCYDGHFNGDLFSSSGPGQ